MKNINYDLMYKTYLLKLLLMDFENAIDFGLLSFEEFVKEFMKEGEFKWPKNTD